jgi:hypothetical protein
LVLFFNGPNFNQLFIEDTWQVHLDKAENIFLNIDSDKPWSHNSKLNHRILAPLFVRVFNLNMIGLFIFQLFSTYWFFQMLYLLFSTEFKINPNSTYFLLIAIGFTYLGVCGVSESKAIFDIFSFSLCLTGFNYRRYLGLFSGAVFLALLNDERSIFTACGFIILSNIVSSNKSLKGYFNRILYELMIGILFYLVYRFYMHVNGVVTHSGGISLNLFIKQINAMPFVYFSFLEGFIIIWLVHFYRILNSHKIKEVMNKYKSNINLYILLLYILSTLSIFIVYDLSRSINYYFPLMLIGIYIFKLRCGEQFNQYSKLLMLINFIIPTYSMWGPYEIYKTFPIPFQIFKSLLM